MPNNPAIDDFERARLSRQMQMPEIGESGQLKLQQSCVFISRAGGVGGTVAAYLARAGIGQLIIAHPGNVDAQYLNRWQLAQVADHQRVAAEVFQESLQKINPRMKLQCHSTAVTPDNANELLQSADLIADSSPLFEERYAMNDAAVHLGKTMVSGAMYSHEGYVTTFIPGQTPCLRCLFPQKPAYWQHHEVFPVLGPCPSLIGSMMAMEIIKLIIGFGNTLANQLWQIDLALNQFNLLTLNPDSRRCQLCQTLPREIR